MNTQIIEIIDRVENFVVKSDLNLINGTSLVFKAVGTFVDNNSEKRKVTKYIQQGIRAALEKIRDKTRKIKLLEILGKNEVTVFLFLFFIVFLLLL